MYEITQSMREWNRDPRKHPLYAATVISVEGSAVRRPGASMGIGADGSLTGSVSGGCIESTVITAAEGFRQQASAGTITFSPDEDPLMGSPAPCGGTVRVCVYPYASAVGDALARRMDSGKNGAWGVIAGGPEGLAGTSFALDEQGELVFPLKPGDGGDDQAGRSGGDDNKLPDHSLNRAALIPLLKTAPHEGLVTDFGGMQVFIQQLPLPPHVIVVGGSHIGEALVEVLKRLHWKVTVVEPRELFAPPERFQAADGVLHLWPEDAFEQLGLKTGLLTEIQPEMQPEPQVNKQNAAAELPALPRYTAVAAITHTEQIDDAAVALGIRNQCFSVGVLGSTRTFSARIKRLKEQGFTDEELDRVHGPIGLDIGAGTPEEIALAIAAEIVQDYRNARQTENRE